MWWLKPSMLVVLSLVIIQASTADPTSSNRFSILEKAGGCTSSHIQWLDRYITDANTLITSFQNALKAARTSNTATGTKGEDGIVARKLLTKYFGIQFQEAAGEQIPKSAYRDYWKQVSNTATKVQNFLTSGTLTGPGVTKGNNFPWISCAGTAFSKFDWNDQVFGYVPNAQTPKVDKITINDQAVSIADAYPNLVDDKNAPYYSVDKTYYTRWPTTMGTDICTNIYGWAVPGQERYEYTVQGETLEYGTTEPGIIMCPDLYTLDVSILSQVTAQNPASTSPIYLQTVMGWGSSTMLHELAHMTTFWAEVTDKKASSYGSIYNAGTSAVLDYAVDIAGCLELAAGTYTDEEGRSYDAYYAGFNARNYELFAFSWWYYTQTWTYKDSSGNTQTYPRATFYDGILVQWDK